MTRKATDPMEKIMQLALDDCGIEYVMDGDKIDKRALGLDFYLPSHAVHIEVKQFHSDRIAGQMKRADNVIALQGVIAVQMFADMLLTSHGKAAS